jgi:hypothetical protein
LEFWRPQDFDFIAENANAVFPGSFPGIHRPVGLLNQFFAVMGVLGKRSDTDRHAQRFDIFFSEATLTKTKSPVKWPWISLHFLIHQYR